MSRIFTEENGVYNIDCSKALWATDDINHTYHNAGVHLSDADFIIESDDAIIIMEYKNSTISSAEHPEAYNPMDDRRINIIARKFYDSLHYLTLLQKNKKKRYIFVVEAANSDSTMRQRLRNRIVSELPFRLQENMNTGIKLIEDMEVLSIAEWNEHPVYSAYPFSVRKADS